MTSRVCSFENTCGPEPAPRGLGLRLRGLSLISRIRIQMLSDIIFNPGTGVDFSFADQTPEAGAGFSKQSGVRALVFRIP